MVGPVAVTLIVPDHEKVDDEDYDSEDEDFDSDKEDSQLGDEDDCSTTDDKTDSDGDSSSHGEIVAVDDCMSQALWTKHFLEDLGHPTELSLFNRTIPAPSSLKQTE